MTFYNVSDGKIFLRKYLHTVTNVQPARDKRVVVWQISFTIVLLVRSLKDYGFECLISRFVETPPPRLFVFLWFRTDDLHFRSAHHVSRLLPRSCVLLNADFPAE